MSYSARISQLNRQTIIFLIDQSGSMNEPIAWGGNETTKAEAVADVVNGALSELLARCNNYGNFKSYFNIAVIGYSGIGVRSLLGDGRRNFHLPSELAYGWKRNEETVNVRNLPNGKQCATKVSKKIWIEPLAEGRTPMVGTLNYVHDLLLVNLSQDENKNSFPPLVINITDGEVNDGDIKQMIECGKRIKSLSTNDGNVLFMNVHIANRDCESLIFPSNDLQCPVECNFGKSLFEMSSVMPEFFEREIEQIVKAAKPYKAFAYNASISDLVRMVNIGSSSTSLIL